MGAPGARTGNPKSRQQAQQADQQIKPLGDGWVSGSLGADPELRYTPTGRAVCNLRLAHNPRYKNEETGRWENGDVIWYGVTVWGDQGENAAECLQKGDRILVGGDFQERTYETRDGDERTVLEVTARDIGPSLLFREAHIKRAQRGGQHGAAESE